jgi:DNA polymerase-1
MNDLPVVQLMIDGLEADDMIAHIANHYSLKDYNKIIVSNDKDFLQLCSKETILFRPVKEEYVNSKKVVEEFGIHPTNFALARAVCGDVSDNLDGVEGVGLKTLAKRVPNLIKEESMSIETLIQFCKDSDNGKIKAYKSISESEKLIERNYQMMQLYSPTISYQSAEKVNYALDNSECTFNIKDFKKRMIEDGFGTLNVEELFNCMKNIVLENCKDNK